MNYFVEIKLLKQAEISMYFIWSKVFAQLHLAFVECKDQNDKIPVGISFPEYMFDSEKGFGMLGSKIRLFAQNKDALITLDLAKWLNRIQDYLQISDLLDVPHSAINNYACFHRKQLKSNPERLARRRAKKDSSITYEEALKKYSKPATCFLPFIQMESQSTQVGKNGKHHFRLFIMRREVENPQAGVFNCYGLSDSATVPLFD